jgi:hypothetical protein
MNRSDPFKIFFFQDYESEEETLFLNSPGLLPFIGYLRSLSFDIEFMLTGRELIESVRTRACNLIAFSSMERRLSETIETAKKIKSQNPAIPMAIGGVTIAPYAQALAADLFDIVVTVEGENVFPALLDTLTDSSAIGRRESAGTVVHAGDIRSVCSASPGGALDPDQVDRLLGATFARKIEGIGTVSVPTGGIYIRDSIRGQVFKINGALSEDQSHKINFSPEPTAAELESQTVFPWDIIEEKKWKIIEFYAQRGCRWAKCRFCSLKASGFRSVSNKKILEILDQAKTQQVACFSFADDVFVHNTKKTKHLLEEIRSRNLGMSFRAQTIADRKIWPLLELMRESGFNEVAYGVETLNPERAEFMQKSFNGDRYIQIAKETILRTALAGIHPRVYLILADPESTLKNIAMELDHILDLGIAVFNASGILPKFSSSVIMLPLKNTWMGEHYAYDVKSVRLFNKTLELPNEFILKDDVSLFMHKISQFDRNKRVDREDLSFFEVCLRALAMTNREMPCRATEEIDLYITSAINKYEALKKTLDACLEKVFIDILKSIAEAHSLPDQAEILSRLNRIDPYRAGIHRLIEKLNHYIRQTESQEHA